MHHQLLRKQPQVSAAFGRVGDEGHDRARVPPRHPVDDAADRLDRGQTQRGARNGHIDLADGERRQLVEQAERIAQTAASDERQALDDRRLDRHALGLGHACQLLFRLLERDTPEIEPLAA